MIVGAGIGGLGSALALRRAGYRVTLLERDRLSSDADPDAAFETQRRGAPQAHHTHGFLARLTGVLRDRFPEVLADLHSAGAYEVGLDGPVDDLRVVDGEARVLIARRTTLEWALRRAVASDPGIDCRDGVAVAGLIGRAVADGAGAAAELPGAAPVEGIELASPPAEVRGVRLASGEVLDATAVIAAGGRRSDVPAWLTPFGVTIDETTADTGIVYLTRWYRHRRGWSPGSDAKLAGDLGFVKFLVIPGDGGTLSATLAIPSKDTRVRSALLDVDRFDRAVGLLPGPDRVFPDAIDVPLGPVHPMGGLVNRIRRFVDGSGQPLVTGFHAVGDSHTCTNPFYGRGCSLALLQAVLLADAFAAHPADPVARAADYEQASAREVEPWYHVSVATDAFGRAAARQRERGSGAVPDSDGDRLSLAMRAVILGGATDPVIGRGVWRVMNMLSTPDQLFTDPDFMRRVQALIADPAALAAATPAGPSRDELLAAVA